MKFSFILPILFFLSSVAFADDFCAEVDKLGGQPIRGMFSENWDSKNSTIEEVSKVSMCILNNPKVHRLNLYDNISAYPTLHFHPCAAEEFSKRHCTEDERYGVNRSVVSDETREWILNITMDFIDPRFDSGLVPLTISELENYSFLESFLSGVLLRDRFHFETNYKEGIYSKIEQPKYEEGYNPQVRVLEHLSQLHHPSLFISPINRGEAHKNILKILCHAFSGEFGKRDCSKIKMDKFVQTLDHIIDQLSFHTSVSYKPDMFKFTDKLAREIREERGL